MDGKIRLYRIKIIMTLIQQLVEKKILDKDKAAFLEREVRSSCKKEEVIILEKGI